MLQKWSCNFHKKCQSFLWTLKNCPLRFVTLDNSRKFGQNLFSTGKFAFFSKTCVYNNLLVLQKWSCIFHTKCQNTLWTLVNCPLRFATLDNARKKTPKSFIYWKFCVFFKIFCFQQPLRCYRNGLVTSTVFVKKIRRPFWIVPWGLSHSILREKIGQKLFLAGKIALFFKNLSLQQPLRSWRKNPITPTAIVRIPCRHL